MINTIRGLSWLITIVCLFSGSAHAAASGQDEARLPEIEYLVAPHDFHPASDVNPAGLGEWQALDGPSPNFGYVDSPYWFRFSLPASKERRQRLIEISYPQLDDVRFFLLTNDRVVDQVTTGDHYPFSQRPVQHPHFLFPVTLEPGKAYEAYIRVKTKGSLQVPIQVWEPTNFFSHISRQDQAHAIYYGILIAIIVFNLVVFLSMRETTYLLYVLATFGYLWLLATLRGVTFPLLWPDTPWLQNQSMLVSIPFVVVFSALFARSFLRLWQSNPPLNKLVLVLSGASLVSLVLSFFIDYNHSVRLSVALAIPSTMLLTLIGPIEWYRGNPAARLYTIAWALLTAGSTMAAMNKYGWLPTNFVTEFGMEIGSALEALILTVALAQRLYRERQQKVEAQEQRLHEHAVRRRAELKLMEQALHDPVTGLPNYTCFEMLVKDAIINRAGERFAIGVVHLTNYNAINKTLGHTNTEQVLLSSARRFNQLAATLPGIQTVERSEHEHFFIAALETGTFAFLLDASVARMNQKAIDRCFDRLNEPVDFQGMRVPLAPVTGVSIYPDHGDDASTLIRQAYIAQESEEAHDRSIAYYEADQDSYSTDRLTQVGDLKAALENGELALYYQPKVSLADQRVVGMEGLIRWPARIDRMDAQTLVTMAEQTGLIKPLTRWVLEEAIRGREAFQQAGYDIDLSINISPYNLREPDFPVFVQRLMTAHASHRGRISLELTETSMMQDPANSLQTLRSLNTTGIPLSIDDFGSGYSSLSYIKKLPAKEIKIDRSLIADLCQQQDDRVIVQATIDMCHSLGYSVVAEGVEREEEWVLLESMGCDMIQGYIIIHPQPFDKMLEWLHGNHKLSRPSSWPMNG
ncbi:EAL domain-containing protein [Marinobacteraceae bacterium S3BR75-40.1]